MTRISYAQVDFWGAGVNPVSGSCNWQAFEFPKGPGPSLERKSINEMCSDLEKLTTC